jgi:hypothetical protein
MGVDRLGVDFDNLWLLQREFLESKTALIIKRVLNPLIPFLRRHAVERGVS